jgi:hypothetical protein
MELYLHFLMSFHGLQKEGLSCTLQLSVMESSLWPGDSVGLLYEGKSAHSLEFKFLDHSVPVTAEMPFFPPLHGHFTFLPEGYKGERMWN